jgi:anti-sigma regulatory factor (Ser/Thr protein kinase)
MNLCSECPISMDCHKCLELIDGGTLRRKVYPPVSVKLYSVAPGKEYIGKLSVISRVGMLIQTNAPIEDYFIEINGGNRAQVSPIHHKGLEGFIAFDIVKIERGSMLDYRLTKDEYDYLFMDKKDLINNLTEELDDNIKGKIREILHNELLKSELLDQLIIGSTFKYEKGTMGLLSGQKPSLLKDKDMINIMEEAIKNKQPKREVFIDIENERYIDLHAIPLGYNTGGILTIDITEIVNKERKLLNEQWENYREVIKALSHGKIIIVDQQELNEISKGYFNKKDIGFIEPQQLAAIRSIIKNELQSRDIPLKLHVGFLLAFQEAATNALKHSKSKQAEVEIWETENKIMIVIKDNGQGIQLQDLPKATLINGFSTTATLGQGFNLMSHFSNTLYLKSDKDGTVVGLEFLISLED